eukprot:c18157_g1_i5.p1 GENE.c18157_g1_i5~~c18157_g1_i5.p1  ORF type:complete len:534 (-),score=69.77 c18157_g1_i5:126-1727(-)
MVSTKHPRKSSGLPFVVRLRGLPYTATVDDLKKFLYPIDVPACQIHLMNGRDGRPSGEAYIELSNETDAKRTLAKHKEHMGTRYIETFRSHPTELDDLLSQGRATHPASPVSAPAKPPSPPAIEQPSIQVASAAPTPVIHDTPPSARLGFSSVVGSNKRSNSANTRTTPELTGVSPIFSGLLDSAASTSPHPSPMWNIGIPNVINLGPRHPQPEPSSVPVRSPLGVGLLYADTGRSTFESPLFRPHSDVSPLLAVPPPFGVTPEFAPRVAIDEPEDLGPFSLPASVSRHPNKTNYMASIHHHRQYYGGHDHHHHETGYGRPEIELENSIPRPHHHDKVGLVFDWMTHHRHSEDEDPGSVPILPSPHPSFDGYRARMHHSWLQNQQYHQQQHAALQQHRMYQQQYAPAALDCMPEMDSHGVDPVSPSLSSSPPNSLGNGSVRRPKAPGMSEESAESVTVKLRGLPYSATEQDVYAFLDGLGFIENTVQLGKNREGRPSGEAWVRFASLRDAQRAVTNRNREHIGNRYIELFIQG